MATNQVKTVTTGADKAKLALSGVLVIASFVAFYLLSGRGSWLQWTGLGVGIVLALIAFFLSDSGRRMVAFGRDAWRETEKVVWPSRKEAIRTTAFVFAFTVAIALILWISDRAIEWILYDLILGWGR